MNTAGKIISFQNEFSRQIYDDGIRQKNQISSKFTPTLTILTTEAGGIIWLVFDFVKNLDKALTLRQACILLLLFATGILFCTAVVFFGLCFTNYTATYPSPEKAKECIRENLQYIGEYTEEEVLDNLMKNIADDYLDIAIENEAETIKHTAYLNKCYRFIVFTLACMLIGFLALVLL